MAISKCDSSIAAIRGLNSEFETTLLEEYKQCHDLPTVLKKDQALKRVKEIEEQRKAEQEQRRQQAEAARAAEEAARAERVSVQSHSDGSTGTGPGGGGTAEAHGSADRHPFVPGDRHCGAAERTAGLYAGQRHRLWPRRLNKGGILS